MGGLRGPLGGEDEPVALKGHIDVALQDSRHRNFEQEAAPFVDQVQAEFGQQTPPPQERRSHASNEMSRDPCGGC